MFSLEMACETSTAVIMKSQGACQTRWMSRGNEAKDGATWHIRARPQSSALRFDNRPADRQPKSQATRFRGVKSFEHAVKSR
jgi:hypothetical protein